ncbi:hypothetical protein [Micromonospora vulcania]|uniref:GerMN domain-containing protein n=1 Tax=Micromonospora vulcania TaxID=1441873 RepID=A0ABW1HCT0_9ACTN
MTGRRVARTLLAGGALLALFTAGCGVRPSDVIIGRPAVSGQAEGVGLYLLWHGQLALVVRPTKESVPPDKVLGLLAMGPDESERSQGFTSEVPTDLVSGVSDGPVPAGSANLTPVPSAKVKTDGNGITLTMAGKVTALSGTAADQIICTVSGPVAQLSQVAAFAPVTIVGTDGARPPRSCPIR